MSNRVPQGHHRDFTIEEVSKAIEGSCGIVNEVAKRLNCHWNTAKTYINKWKQTRELLQYEREVGLDMAEKTIFDAVKSGDTNTAKWILNQLAKTRGFSEKQVLEHTGKDGEPLSIQVKFVSEDG